MLSRHTCVYRDLRRESTVSISNRFEKMFVSFAPKPWRPPVRRTSSSSKFEPVKRYPNTSSGTNGPSACRVTGSPRPLFRIEISGSLVVPPLMCTSILFIVASRCRLSAALTRISSNILHTPGTTSSSRRSIDGVPSSTLPSSKTHVAVRVGATEPMYIPGRSRTCSSGVLRSYTSALPPFEELDARSRRPAAALRAGWRMARGVCQLLMLDFLFFIFYFEKKNILFCLPLHF